MRILSDNGIIMKREFYENISIGGKLSCFWVQKWKQIFMEWESCGTIDADCVLFRIDEISLDHQPRIEILFWKWILIILINKYSYLSRVKMKNYIIELLEVYWFNIWE